MGEGEGRGSGEAPQAKPSLDVCVLALSAPFDIRKTGTGPRWSAMWLDGEGCIVKGFHEWPKVGDRHEIDGVLYRLVEIGDRWVWGREAS